MSVVVIIHTSLLLKLLFSVQTQCETSRTTAHLNITHHVQETQQVLGHDEIVLRKTFNDVFTPRRTETALHVYHTGERDSSLFHREQGRNKDITVCGSLVGQTTAHAHREDAGRRTAGGFTFTNIFFIISITQ